MLTVVVISLAILAMLWVAASKFEPNPFDDEDDDDDLYAGN